MVGGSDSVVAVKMMVFAKGLLAVLALESTQATYLAAARYTPQLVLA